MNLGSWILRKAAEVVRWPTWYCCHVSPEEPASQEDRPGWSSLRKIQSFEQRQLNQQAKDLTESLILAQNER
jgi:hypothetical protein